MMRRYGLKAGFVTTVVLLLVACGKSDSDGAKTASQVPAPVASPAVSAPTVLPPAPIAKPAPPQAPPPPLPIKRTYQQPSSAEFAAFINAADQGNIAGVKRYMASGFDINKKAGDDKRYGSRAGHTAVSRAAYAGKLGVVQLLLESGAHVDGDTLRAGALGGNPRVVRYLLDANMKYSRSELSIAAVSGIGNAAILGMLLDAGADPNFRVDKGWTPLTFAAADGKVDSVRLLLARGANPNDPGSRDTPLIMAAYGGHLPTIKLLVAAGANVNAVGNDGRTPFQAAMSARKRDAAEFLRAQTGGRPPHGGNGRPPHDGGKPPPPAAPMAPVVGTKPVPPPPPANGIKPQDNVAINLMCQMELMGQEKQKIVTYKVGEKIYAISDPARIRAKRRGWIDGYEKFSRAEMQELMKRGVAKCP